MPMFLASRLPVPAGIRPNGTPVPASPAQITRMVACSVIARPGSSVVVSSHRARSQPRVFSSYSTCRRKVTQSVTLVGLKITAARRRCSGGRSVALPRTISVTSSYPTGTSTPPASSAIVATRAPSSAPPTRSVM
jgi:hypothetical protein